MNKSVLAFNLAWFGESAYILPNWAWVAIAAVVVVLVVLIIALAVRSKRRKKAEAKNAELSKTVYDETRTYSQPEPAPERADEGPAKLTPVEAVEEEKQPEPEKEEQAEEVKEEQTEEQPEEQPEPKPAPKSAAKPAAKATPKTTSKPAAKPASKPAAKPAAKSAAAAKPAPKSAAKPATAAKPAAKVAPKEKDEDKVYHISRRKDENKWQIKAEGGAKAIKLFNTQAEAIEYAKQLADNQDARIMIHKADGSFRRLDYKS